MQRLWIAALFTLLNAGTAWARQVEVICVGKVPTRGEFLAHGKADRFRLKGPGGPMDIALDEVVEVVFRPGTPEPQDRDTLLILENGDRLAGDLIGGTDDQGGLIFKDKALGRIVFSDFGRVRWVLFPPVREAPRVPNAQRENDVVFRTEGGAVSGSIRSFESESVKIERPDMGLTLDVAFADARAVYIAPLLDPTSSSSLVVVLMLTNGAILTGKPALFGADSLRVELVTGNTVSVPYDVIATLGTRNGRFDYLSDIEPVRIKENPWLVDPPETHTPPFEGKVIYNYHRDRNYKGGPLKIAGRTFLKGIGSHTYTEIEYALDGAYASFEAAVGIDDCAGAGNGSVIFRVILDGKEAYKSPVMTGGTRAREVRVDLNGAKRMVLIVDFTSEKPGEPDEDGHVEEHVLDRADWGGARLVKK